MHARIRCMTPVVVAGVMSLFVVDVSHAALTGRTAALSGKLSANKAVRQQQLIADPASPGPLALGAPRRGSTSIMYDAGMVSLSGLELGTGYRGSALVEVRTEGGRTALQDL